MNRLSAHDRGTFHSVLVKQSTLETDPKQTGVMAAPLPAEARKKRPRLSSVRAAVHRISLASCISAVSDFYCVSDLM